MIEPLASVLRPKTLDDMVGQQHILTTISSFLSHGKMPSLLFRGTPGCGKTTLAGVIASQLGADFFQLSGVTSKKEDLKAIIGQAKMNASYGKQTLVFLDEIHRRNKAQQDTLLPFVESGLVVLIGATTENPSFTINNALLSRCKLLVFNPLTAEDIVSFFHQNKEKILSLYPDILLTDENFTLIASLSNGDLRNACNILESAILFQHSGAIDEDMIIKAFGKPVYYDRDGEEHYNIISAIHKSLRDSDPHAACYRIQRMLAGGEDPLYIARRLLRFASEDIGPADNNALLLANQVYESIQKIGMPECKIFLFQLALYLAKAPKNNICYRIDHMTLEDIERYGNLPVPMVIRNAPTKMMKNLGYGKGYQYAHSQEENRQSDGTIKTDNQHFPDELKDRTYF